MVNKSEKLLSAFSKLYFFNELVHDNLKFIPSGSTEKELADILLNLGDIIIAIQLKGREKEDISNEDEEIKWLKIKCREAKKQIKKTIEFIRNEDLPCFENGSNQNIKLNKHAKIIPLIVFNNNIIKEYEHVLWKHSDEGMDVNCMSYEDFQKMCEVLITPIEIVEYLEWRLEFYRKNRKVDILIHDREEEITIMKPKNNNSSVYYFLSERYGIKNAQELEVYMKEFREFFQKLPSHIETKSEENADFEIISFFAHFNRLEINLFIERLNLAKTRVENGDYYFAGSLRNIQRKYQIVFFSSRCRDKIPMELILDSIPNKEEVSIVLQIIVSFESFEDFKIDFYYCELS
ncbi:hypothetical protein B5E58_12400 [Tyzzerella sp. An114]|uniref:hypothetical protein n=1 Tax=Tyzzerella sp. An114 TaxID=1965545 RepID=UPI000B439FEA|nr:hypothetical protein [Tyzzerella sp. An114]OUQ55373.1 hypothetical protein B5E58_12400 [Tyzzerella sp. An114]